MYIEFYSVDHSAVDVTIYVITTFFIGSINQINFDFELDQFG